MRGHSATRVLLLAVVLSQQLITVDSEEHKPSPSGMPLSEAEYKDFFRVMSNPQRRGMVCFLRETYGCQHAWIKDLDKYENHGLIPEGQVCSTHAEHPTFPDFCSLAMYRCTSKEYFVKRVLCPTEISKPSSNTQMIDQQVDPEHSTSSIQALHSITDSITVAATAVTSTKSFFAWFPSIFSKTATEVYPPTLRPEFHTTPTPVASTTNSVTSPAPAGTRKSLFHLLESALKLLVPTAARSKIESRMKQLTASETVTAGETSPQLTTTTTTTTTTAFLSQLHSYSATTMSEDLVPEFSTTTAAATTTTLSSTTSIPTTTATTLSSTPTSIITTATPPTPSSTPPTPTSTGATSSTSMQFTTSGATATTTKSTSQLPSHSPFAAPSSTTKTSANHLPMSSTVSSLSTKATTSKSTGIVSSSTIASQAQSGPGPSPSQKQSLQSNSNLGIFHFSIFLHHKPGDRLGLSPSLQVGARSPDAQQLNEIPQFPTSNLRDIFFQMQDRTVQQLMQDMPNLMAKEKITQNQQLQATSLLVLRALNLANVQKTSKRSPRLQRKMNHSPF